MVYLFSVMCLLTAFGASSSYAADAADSTRFVFSDTASTDMNLLYETLKMFLALGLTLVLLIVVLWVLRNILRARGMQGLSGGAVRILEIRHIDPRKSIALVKVVDRVIIVGCSEQTMSSLGELSPEEIDRLNVSGTESSGVFKSILAGFKRPT
ncbi:flagellar biosynthetic protein FliO [Candidatus Latescibacterota bacterium]